MEPRRASGTPYPSASGRKVRNLRALKNLLSYLPFQFAHGADQMAAVLTLDVGLVGRIAVQLEAVAATLAAIEFYTHGALFIMAA